MATCQCWSFFHIMISSIHPMFTTCLPSKTDPNVSQIHQSNGLFISNEGVKMHPCLIPAYVQLSCPFSNFQTVPNSWGWWILRCVVQVPLRWYTWRGTDWKDVKFMVLDVMNASFLCFAVVHHQFVKYSKHFCSTPFLADADSWSWIFDSTVSCLELPVFKGSVLIALSPVIHAETDGFWARQLLNCTPFASNKCSQSSHELHIKSCIIPRVRMFSLVPLPPKRPNGPTGNSR